jgi:NAD(P)-dependent dehydrogenase (short-subunit alcohol dehydrogenase family)
MPEGGSIIMFGSMSGQVSPAAFIHTYTSVRLLMFLNLKHRTTSPVSHFPNTIIDADFAEAAVRHMGRSLAVEWAKQGIRVNVIRYAHARIRAG